MLIHVQACLYSSACVEFINWDTRDDLSWLGTSEAGTLFDSNGNPKVAAFEVQARLQRFLSGAPMLCATALGTSSCMASGPTTTSAGGAPTTTPTTTTIPTTTTAAPPPPTTTTAPTGGTAAHWGQCGGIGWTGPTGKNLTNARIGVLMPLFSVCASPFTCQVSNAYVSPCLVMQHGL